MQDTTYKGEKAQLAQVEFKTSEVDKLGKAVATIECLCGMMEKANDEGGLTHEAAQAVQMTLESLMDDIGIQKPAIYAIEDFKDPATRVTAGILTTESLKEALEVGWNKIIEGLKAVLKWLGEIFEKYFTSYGRIRASAKKLNDAAAKFKKENASNAGNIQLADNTLISLSIGGKISQNLPTDVKTVIDFTRNAYSGSCIELYEKWFIKFGTVAQGYSKNGTANAFTEASRTLESLLGTLTAAITHSGLKPVSKKERVTTYASPEMLGCMVVYAQVPNQVEFIRDFTIRMNIESSAAEKQSRTVKSLTIDEVGVVTKLIYDNVEFEVGKLMNFRRRFEGVIASLTAAHMFQRTKEADSENPDRKASALFMDSLRAANHITKGVHYYASIIANQSLHAAIKYCEESLKATAVNHKVA